MKIETNEQGETILKEVFNGVGLESRDGEKFGICMRDTGFEFNYAGQWYEAKNGLLCKFADYNNPTISREMARH